MFLHLPEVKVLLPENPCFLHRFVKRFLPSAALNLLPEPNTTNIATVCYAKHLQHFPSPLSVGWMIEKSLTERKLTTTPQSEKNWNCPPNTNGKDVPKNSRCPSSRVNGAIIRSWNCSLNNSSFRNGFSCQIWTKKGFVELLAIKTPSWPLWIVVCCCNYPGTVFLAAIKLTLV